MKTIQIIFDSINHSGKVDQLSENIYEMYCPYIAANYFSLENVTITNMSGTVSDLFNSCSDFIQPYNFYLAQHIRNIDKKFEILIKKFGPDIASVILEQGWGLFKL